jgi:hypothetical protein
MTTHKTTSRSSLRGWLGACVLAVLPFGTAVATPFTLTSNTLVAVDYGTRSLIEYSFDGHINESLALTGSFSTLSGVEVIGNTVYVMGVAGDVGIANLSTGAVTRLFTSKGDEGLGSRNGNLLALSYDGSVSEYDLRGTLLHSYSVDGGGTGVDGVAGGFAVANYDDAILRIYNSTGILQSSFDTGLDPGEISDVAFDSTSGSYWVASGFGRADIRQYSSNGVLLGSFAAQRYGLNGIDVVHLPTSVPEPSVMALFGIGFAGVAACRRRKKHR